MGEGPTWITASVHVCGTHQQEEGEAERGDKVTQRKPEHVPVQSDVSRHPQPQAEELQVSGRRWDPASGPWPGETGQAGVSGAGVSVLCSSDAVDSEQTKPRSATQTAGGVSQLPLAVAARHREEQDRHGLQVTPPKCVSVRRFLLDVPSEPFLKDVLNFVDVID